MLRAAARDDAETDCYSRLLMEGHRHTHPGRVTFEVDYVHGDIDGRCSTWVSSLHRPRVCPLASAGRERQVKIGTRLEMLPQRCYRRILSLLSRSYSPFPEVLSPFRESCILYGKLFQSTVSADHVYSYQCVSGSMVPLFISTVLFREIRGIRTSHRE